MPKISTPKPPAKQKAPPALATPPGRKVLYPELKMFKFVGDKPMTVVQMKAYLGWQAESEDQQFGEDYLFKDFTGTKIRLLNNTHNRPYFHQWAVELAHVFVNKQWELNGETCIIGEYGTVLSCQHRGVGLCLAEQLRTGGNASQYEDLWGDSEVTAEMLVVVGVKETPNVTRTLDNVRPRTLTDVMFADEEAFRDVGTKERQHLSRMAQFAVAMLRSRTGANSAFKPRRTHTAEVETWNNHPRLKDAVMHIYTETKGKSGPAKLMAPGTAAALMYLMGCSGGDGEAYHAARRQKLPHGDDQLEWGNWKKSASFWAGLFCDNSRTPAFAHEVRQAIANCSAASGEGGATYQERLGIIIKAWNLYVADGGVDAAALKLKYISDGGVNKLIEFPTIEGGADLGDADRKAVTVTAQPEVNLEELNLDTDDGAEDPEMTQEQIAEVEQRKAVVQRQKVAGVTPPAKAPTQTPEQKREEMRKRILAQRQARAGKPVEVKQPSEEDAIAAALAEESGGVELNGEVLHEDQPATQAPKPKGRVKRK